MSRRRRKKKRKTSNIVLVLLGICILLFTISMIVTFWFKGSVPDTLIQYTLGAGGIEALLLAGIKISKVLTESKSKSKAASNTTESEDDLS